MPKEFGVPYLALFDSRLSDPVSTIKIPFDAEQKWNYTPMAAEISQQRCIWIDVDYKNPGDLVKKVQEQANKVCVNNYTSTFCLADHDETREETTLRLIKEIINA